MNAIKLIVLKPSIDFLSNLKEKTKKFKKGKKRHRLLCGFWIFNDNFLLFLFYNRKSANKCSISIALIMINLSWLGCDPFLSLPASRIIFFPLFSLWLSRFVWMSLKKSRCACRNHSHNRFWIDLWILFPDYCWLDFCFLAIFFLCLQNSFIYHKKIKLKKYFSSWGNIIILLPICQWFII